jgi:hypothetical protein
MGSVEFFAASLEICCRGSLMRRMLMSEFPVFGSGDEFLCYLEQLVADIRGGRIEDPPYHAVFLANQAEAEESLAYHRDEAVRLGFDPDRVVMLRELWGRECDDLPF